MLSQAVLVLDDELPRERFPQVATGQTDELIPLVGWQSSLMQIKETITDAWHKVFF